MSQRLTRADILHMVLEEHGKTIDELVENLKMYSGKGDNQKPVISPGFKLIHKKTGLNYTVVGIENDGDGHFLVTVKPNGEEFKIKRSDLKNYDRL